MLYNIRILQRAKIEDNERKLTLRYELTVSIDTLTKHDSTYVNDPSERGIGDVSISELTVFRRSAAISNAAAR